MLPAVWVLGTVTSTGVAYAAVQMVAGSVVDGQREPLAAAPFAASAPTPIIASPAGSSPTATPSPATTPSPAPTQGPTPSSTPSPPAQQTGSSSRTIAVVGGTAQVTCSGGAIALNWATPNSGFWVETSTQDGGAVIEVRFRSDTHESRVEAQCAAGNVQFTVREESS